MATKGVFLAVFAFVVLGVVNGHTWPMFGQNYANTRGQGEERILTRETVCDVEIDWTFESIGDVSCTVTERGGLVYFTDWRGALYCLDEDTGRVQWQVETLGSFVGARAAVSHSSPLITDQYVIIGTAGSQRFEADPEPTGSAILAAFWKLNGTLAWTVRLDTHDTARIDQSPIEADGFVYVGTSSMEGHLTEPSDPLFDPSFSCCSFQGTLFKIEVSTGTIEWSADLSMGGTGASAFGSTAAVDNGLVFVTTGSGHGDDPAPGGSSCHAFDVTNGDLVWSSKLEDDEDWFAQGPLIGRILSGDPDEPDTTLVMTASVGGVVIARNARTGSVVWERNLAPGGMIGGSFWGSATDGDSRLFVAVTHGEDPDEGGFWYGINIMDGAVIWETQVPVFREGNSGAVAWAWGAVSYANDIVYCPAIDNDGTLFALNADTGGVLNSWATGGTLVSGASISGSRIFVGSGYAHGIFSQMFFERSFVTTSRRVHSLKWQYNP